MPDHNDQAFPWYYTFRNETRMITCVGPDCSAYFQTAADMVMAAFMLPVTASVGHMPSS